MFHAQDHFINSKTFNRKGLIPLLTELIKFMKPGFSKHCAPDGAIRFPINLLILRRSKHQLQLRKQRIKRLAWTDDIGLAEIANVCRTVA